MKMFDVQRSEAFRRLRDAERVAQNIFYNAPLHVPGTLQVPAFAQEIICGLSGLPAEDPEAVERIAQRNARHTAFLERLHGPDAPQVHIVIDESALRRASAGPAGRTQVEYLIEVSRKSAVHLEVIPWDHGAHRGLAGQFEVHDGLVFFEGGDGDHIVDDLDRVALYRNMVESLMGTATTGEAARALMSKLVAG